MTQSVARLTQDPEVPGSIPGQTTYFRFSFRWIQEVTGESMCMKYWLTGWEVLACPGKVWLD